MLVCLCWVVLAEGSFLSRKHRCKDCQRKHLLEVQKRNVDGWQCTFDDSGDVWCPHSDVPKAFRLHRFCLDCDKYKSFMADAEAEDEALMDEIDDFRLNGGVF
jgi:hypothetical protein